MINVRLRNHYLFEKLSFHRKKFIKRHFYFNKEDWQFQSLYFCNLFLPISIFSDKKNGISFFAFSFLWLVPFKTSLQIHRLPSHSLKRLKIYRKKSFVNIYRAELTATSNFKDLDSQLMHSTIHDRKIKTVNKKNRIKITFFLFFRR